MQSPAEIEKRMSSVFCRHLRLPAVAALILCFLAAGPASAGWVEDRADGTTVIHVVLSQHVLPDPTKTDIASLAGMAAVREFERQFPHIFEAK